MKRVVITGAAGFVASHLLEHLIKQTNWHFIVVDRLTYAGSLHRITHLPRDRWEFLFHDLRAPISPQNLARLGRVDYFLHLAAESHVDNSLTNPLPFIESNVIGTFNLLEAARTIGCERFMQMSTDEVFGPAPDGVDYRETDTIRPSNPYSAAKASSEALAYAWNVSFGVPFFGVRGMNMFGQRQHREKMVPLCIKKITRGEVVTIHGNRQVIGARKWIHARNTADAILFLLNQPSEKVVREWFHVAGEERTNLEIAQLIAGIVNKKLQYDLVDFHSARPGHDRRYSLCDEKIRNLGWKPPVGFVDSLRETVEWTLKPENRIWLEG